MGPASALLPLLLFVALLGLRLSAAAAGAVSACLALAIAVLAFGYPLTAMGLLGLAFEALFSSAVILWIIFPALGIYELQTRTGATRSIGIWLSSISAQPQIAALLIAWFFALFLEGAAGFGTPVALAAPMLVALGFPALKALVMALIGHAAGVTFGAVGTPVIPLLATAPVDPAALSILMLLTHAALGWLLVLLLFRLARPKEEGLRACWLWAVAASAMFFVPAAALAWFAGPELPTLGGAFIGVLLFVGLIRWKRPATAGPVPRGEGSLLAAAMPYLLVLLLILLSRLASPLADFLRGIELSWRIGDKYGGVVSPLYHPGTMLLVGLLGSAALVGRREGAWAASLRGAGARLPPVALALVSVLLLARIMVHSGMIDVLARSATDLLGADWAVAAPLAGALGSFITGSATASNILLADFQVAAAGTGNHAALVALAGQGVVAGIGNIVAPHNIVAGAATVGLVGREGDVLKRTLPICVAYALAGGAVLLVVNGMF